MLRVSPLLDPLKAYVENRFEGSKRLVPRTESSCNWLHYRVTAILFLAASVIVTCLDWVGDEHTGRITCMIDKGKQIPIHVINSYCYITGTFVLPKYWNANAGKNAVQDGVGPINLKEDDEIQYKNYYQWVPFVLFLQCMMFYTPHSIFKMWEGDKVQTLMNGLDQIVLQKGDRVKREQVLAEYVLNSENTHNLWAVKMLLIDFLYLCNVGFNIFFIDVFLGYEFTTFGIDVVRFINQDFEYRTDPMMKVFPRVTKCSFYTYGASGTVQNHDAMCILPINIVNEKIYVFFWFWLVFLACVTLLDFVYQVLISLNPIVVKFQLRLRLRKEINKRMDIDWQSMDKSLQVGDWKLLYILSKNMESMAYEEFLYELSRLHKKDWLSDNVTKEDIGESKPILVA